VVTASGHMVALAGGFTCERQHGVREMLYC
jgi:hypothetical protein